MNYRVSFSDGIGIAGIVLTAVFLVLDKAGKLKGGWLYGLLLLAGAMTLFIAIGNSWVLDAPAKWKLWRAALTTSVTALVCTGAAIWISGASSGAIASLPQHSEPFTENLHTSDTISVKVERTVPLAAGPRILLYYSWRRNLPDEGLTLFNDGTEAALNLEFWDIQRGNWRVRFPHVAMLEKGKRVTIHPVELAELSAPQYTKPYTRTNPTFGMFLEKLSRDKAIPESVDPIDVTVSLSYQSASTSDKLRSLNVVNYSRKERSAQAKFLACGKVEAVN